MSVLDLLTSVTQFSSVSVLVFSSPTAVLMSYLGAFWFEIHSTSWAIEDLWVLMHYFCCVFGVLPNSCIPFCIPRCWCELILLFSDLVPFYELLLLGVVFPRLFVYRQMVHSLLRDVSTSFCTRYIAILCLLGWLSPPLTTFSNTNLFFFGVQVFSLCLLIFLSIPRWLPLFVYCPT